MRGRASSRSRPEFAWWFVALVQWAAVLVAAATVACAGADSGPDRGTARRGA